jgi:hypothetical protein
MTCIVFNANSTKAASQIQQRHSLHQRIDFFADKYKNNN